MRFGFVKDESNLKLKEVLNNNVRLKEIHIDICSENPLINSSIPFMLLLRTIEKNIIVENNGDRLVLKKDDVFKTCFMNILFSNITECFCKISDNHSEFILNIQNIYYRITVLN